MLTPGPTTYAKRSEEMAELAVEKLHNQYTGDQNSSSPKANITNILKIVYNDIEKYGTAENTEFAEG